VAAPSHIPAVPGFPAGPGVVSTALSSEHRFSGVWTTLEPLRPSYHNYSMTNLSPLPEPLP
jgi:hypothetical protein